MKKMYAPWRSKYIVKEPKNPVLEAECPFCNQIAQNKDKENFILKRLDHSLIILNLYPYNAGHVMILPYEHKQHLEDLSQEARFEIIEWSSKTTNILNKTLKPDGINIGLNIGKASGGSIPEHLHMHIIPRWFGDTGFLVTMADTKPISIDLKEIYQILIKSFENISLEKN